MSPRRLSIRDVPTEVLECIAQRRHHTEIVHVERRTQWGVPVSHRCVRCGTERHETIDLQGNVSNYSYVYPREYRDMLDEAVDRSDARLELVDRARKRLSATRRLTLVKQQAPASQKRVRKAS